MKLNYIVSTSIIVLLLSSCGVITKARYGNGLKLNLELGSGNEKNLSKKTGIPKKLKKLRLDSAIHLLEVENPVTNRFDDASITYFDVRKDAHLKSPIFDNNENYSHILRTKHWNKTKSLNKQNQSEEKTTAPIEPNSKAAGYLFYGSILMSILMSILGIAVPILSVILFLAWLLGLILAITGLNKIKKSGDKYRGYGLDISIIVLSILSVILLIGAVALAVALF